VISFGTAIDAMGSPDSGEIWRRECARTLSENLSEPMSDNPNEG
jgi:hypothetical protein